MNCRVRADFPTPPLPTMITLWRARDVWFLFLPEAMTLACRDQQGQAGTSRDRQGQAGTDTGWRMDTNRIKHIHEQCLSGFKNTGSCAGQKTSEF